ncbi:cytochrome P450 [Xylariaceae sp. FL1272]|nr:cytochrome P450 [Xylariaceae sp. FL1272]
MKMYKQVPLLHQTHQNYGNTFQLRTLISKPTICTIDRHNIQLISTSPDFGVEPMKLCSLEHFCSNNFVKCFHSALTYSMYRVMLGPAWNLPPQKKYTETCAAAHEYLEYYINEALESDHSFKMDRRSKGLQGLITHDNNDMHFIRSQVILALMAARETTSELLTNALLIPTRYPKYWVELGTEFSAVAEADLSADMLLALRLCPIFPSLGPNGDRPLYIKKGSLVVMSYYALHRDPNVLGDDIETFRRERWETIKSGVWEFMGFGGGERSCVGRCKALVEAAYVLVRTSQCFEKAEARDEREWEGRLKWTCESANECKVAGYIGTD